MELATGYAALANGGFAVQPYFISRIEDEKGKLLFQAKPTKVCKPCEEADSLNPTPTPIRPGRRA